MDMENSIRKYNTIKRSFVDRVQKFASVHDLFTEHSKYIVALSGGADSVALLLLMKDISVKYSLDIDAAHCNFNLRGKESYRDEEFCKALCNKLHIKLHVVHFDTREYARLHNVSIEMAARDLRYGYFENLRHDIKAKDVCVAHHRDDSVETVLLNLIRGTGIRGLRGIMPRNGNVIRPLLCMGKNDILEYLKSIRQDYVTDSSNLIPDVKRNRLRIDVLPLLKKINPSVQQSIFESTMHVNEALKLYDAAIEKSINEVLDSSTMSKDRPVRFSLERLASQVSPEITLFHILKIYNFSSAQVKDIESSINRTQQSAHFLSATHELCIDRGYAIVQPINYKVSTRQLCIPENGTYVFGSDTKFILSNENVGPNYIISKDSFCVCLDAADVAMPLTVRRVEKGDRFTPFGMTKTKLVSDYMTDRKFSLFEKNRQLVVTDAYGNIIWLVGERTDNRFRVKKDTTLVLKIKYISN